jgi:hypothetical protein
MPTRKEKSSTPIADSQIAGLSAFVLQMHALREGKRYPRFVLPYKGYTYLLYIKHEHEPDENWALRLENMYCLLRKVLPPVSSHDALLILACRNIIGIPVKKTGGRPINWLRDAHILMAVDWCCKQMREVLPGCVPEDEPTRYSITEASEKVAEEFAAERKFLNPKGKPLTASAIESAYYAAKKRLFFKCIFASEMSSTWAFPPKH